MVRPTGRGVNAEDALGGPSSCALLTVFGRFHPSKAPRRETANIAASVGDVAQLVEHLLCKQGVRSSILLSSTKFVRKGCLKVDTR